jgi:hypothetical protein
MGRTRMTLPSLVSWTDPADEQVDEGAAPVAAAPLQRPGEADHPSAVGQPGHRQPGGGGAGAVRGQSRDTRSA